MKRCPQCQRAYTDDTLRFCLDDGAPLSASYRPEAAGRATEPYRDEPQTEVLPAVYPPRQASQRGFPGYLYVLGSLLVVAIGVVVVSAGILIWLKFRGTDAPAKYSTPPGTNRRSTDGGPGRTPPTPTPTASPYADSLTKLLLGSWTWGSFMETFSPDGTGTLTHEGKTCFNYRYDVSGGVLHLVVVGEQKCGPSGLDYRISIEGDQMRQEFTGNGYVSNWQRVR